MKTEQVKLRSEQAVLKAQQEAIVAEYRRQAALAKERRARVKADILAVIESMAYEDIADALLDGRVPHVKVDSA